MVCLAGESPNIRSDTVHIYIQFWPTLNITCPSSLRSSSVQPCCKIVIAGTALTTEQVQRFACPMYQHLWNAANHWKQAKHLACACTNTSKCSQLLEAGPAAFACPMNEPLWKQQINGRSGKDSIVWCRLVVNHSLPTHHSLHFTPPSDTTALLTNSFLLTNNMMVQYHYGTLLCPHLIDGLYRPWFCLLLKSVVVLCEQRWVTLQEKVCTQMAM